MSEKQVIDTADRRTIQQRHNLRRGVDQQIDIVKESGGPRSSIGNALFPGFPADPALAKGLGDDHAPPGAQDGPFHGIRQEGLT